MYEKSIQHFEGLNEKCFIRTRKKWNGDLVVRKEIERIAGLISPMYLANLDSEGKGSPNRVKVGRMLAYHVDSLIQWLEHRDT